MLFFFRKKRVELLPWFDPVVILRTKSKQDQVYFVPVSDNYLSCCLISICLQNLQQFMSAFESLSQEGQLYEESLLSSCDYHPIWIRPAEFTSSAKASHLTFFPLETAVPTCGHSTTVDEA